MLLRRFKEERHDKRSCDFEQVLSGQNGRVFRPSVVGNGAGPPVTAFPSPGVDQDDQDMTLLELIKQESKLISSQIRWVEGC